MPEEIAILERELQDTKEYASALSGINERNKKEIGELRKAAAEVTTLEGQVLSLKAALGDAQAMNKALPRALEKANAATEAADKAVAAGKAISEALDLLASL